jgi:transketolase
MTGFWRRPHLMGQSAKGDENLSIRTNSSSFLDNLCINTIRFLAVDAVQKANSGHPGLPMGAAPMAYVLWTRHFKHHPARPDWFDRDRFVLSAGHGSMLLYALLHLTGYDLPLEEIKKFRQWGSITPGHPERGLTPGVETTTGPLGQGFGNAVGLAVAERFLASRYNRPGLEIVSHFTYCLASDGDLMEGVGAESASIAGQLKLGKLICLYDNNHISLSAATDLTFSEDRAGRFAAYGWHVQSVDNGNDLAAIDKAIRAARDETQRPSLILVRTHIGYGSPHKQDTFEAHGSPLGEEEVRLTKQNLGWPLEPAFLIPQEALARFREALTRGEKAEAEWNSRLDSYSRTYPGPAEELRRAVRGELPENWSAGIPAFSADPKGLATRVTSGRVLNEVARRIPTLIGGSADLDPSTHTALKGLGDFENPDRQADDRQGSAGGEWSFAGRNLHYGVREHAMGAITNGLAVHGGIIPYASTFLIFSDYMRPSVRLAALIEVGAIYVFTHDSIGLGEDGPTHQPVEQLASLRAIPNLIVIRPADANETAVAWKVAIEERRRPVALVLTRQSVPVLDRARYASADGLRRGAYVLADPAKSPSDLILIASGSEVGLIVEAGAKLSSLGVAVRLVSMPSWELFDAQPREYRDSVLPPMAARLSVEAASPQGWCKYVGDRGEIIGLDRFGASAPGPVVLEKLGFTADNIVERAMKLAGRPIFGSPSVPSTAPGRPGGAVKIAPSILSADFGCLEVQVREAEAAGADYIHVDIMDGRFVPNMTIGPVVVRAIRPFARVPFDIHLMISSPERYIGEFAAAGADIITVQLEACVHLHRVVQQIKELGKRAGVAINPATPASALVEILPFLDLVLVMTVEPGFGGQSFIETMPRKIAEVRRMIDERGLGVELEVDGGIHPDTAPRAVRAGAGVLVAGSAVFTRDMSVAEAMRTLRRSLDP